MAKPVAQSSSGSLKSPDAFRTISEVSNELGLPQHVLRFWETRFSQIRPMKRGGGRRLYRPDHVALLRGIKALLYDDGMTIKGVQKVLREKGAKTVIARGDSGAELTLEATVPDDASERLAAIKARVEASDRITEAGETGLPGSGASDLTGKGGGKSDRSDQMARVRASISRLEDLLSRLERD